MNKNIVILAPNNFASEDDVKKLIGKSFVAISWDVDDNHEMIYCNDSPKDIVLALNLGLHDTLSDISFGDI